MSKSPRPVPLPPRGSITSFKLFSISLPQGALCKIVCLVQLRRFSGFSWGKSRHSDKGKDVNDKNCMVQSINYF